MIWRWFAQHLYGYQPVDRTDIAKRELRADRLETRLLDIEERVRLAALRAQAAQPREENE